MNRGLVLLGAGLAIGVALARWASRARVARQVPVSDPEPAPHVDGQQMPINGTELFVSEHGSGLPCLVMHGGLGVDHTYLKASLDGLGDVLHLIYYDQRGNGRSGRPSIETLTFEQFAADADALRARLGLDRIAVLGHSFGGYLALEYALRYPERVSHLILVDAASVLTPVTDLLKGALRRRLHWSVLRTLLSPPPPDDSRFGERLVALAALYYHAYDAERTERLHRGRVLSVSANIRGGHLLRGYDIRPRLGAIRAPTLLLVGADDIVNPPWQSERMQAAIPDAELVVFGRSGHYPFEEEPVAFQAAVRDWLARHPASRGAPRNPSSA